MTSLGSPAVDRMERLGPDSFVGRSLERKGNWVVAFLATWCPFCREFAPSFAALEQPGVNLAVADLSQLTSPLWDLFEIEVVPTIIGFRDGKELVRLDGRLGEGLDEADLATARARLIRS
jgi:thioredoxin 1